MCTLSCKYNGWYWLNELSGELRYFNCGSWYCDDHKAAVAYKWATRVALARPERMITLTQVPQDRETAYLAFQQLVRDFRADGIKFEYCRFLEVGSKTGMYHFHLAQKGDFIPKRYLSSRASANGLGRVTDIRRCQQRGPEWYLAKYITKDTAPRGWRKVTSSRGFFPKQETKEPEPGWMLVKR